MPRVLTIWIDKEGFCWSEKTSVVSYFTDEENDAHDRKYVEARAECMPGAKRAVMVGHGEYKLFINFGEPKSFRWEAGLTVAAKLWLRKVGACLWPRSV